MLKDLNVNMTINHHHKSRMNAERSMRCFSIAISITILFGTGAFACPEYIDHAPEQLAELEINLRQDDSVFTKMLAFEQLVCSSNAGIRSSVLREGLSSKDADLRTLAFHSSVVQKKAIVVVPYDDGQGLTEEQLQFLKEFPAIKFDVYFSDLEKKCLSTYFQYDDECRAGSQITFDGLTLNIDGGGSLSATFTLGEDGVLTGNYYSSPKKITVPARVSLF